ncbi:FkbM family methyltransferase [Stappia sp. ES.058]|uniref:FkbM family methyltransferase n=1 Tax=Stappia sp. ES.058 TaxID=1881061 RepID=UPI00087D8B5C|nr:FkbM family methyltransferase [Stappia sp. ES.058]SDU39925.1 methyltransferase, FkbM family [Stappia sp. ES.058]
MRKFKRKIKKRLRRWFAPDVISIDGIKISTSRDDVTETIRQGLYKESYEEPERKLVRVALTPQDRVLEIGAGIGLVSLTCAKICGSDKVLSYEPNPLMGPLIKKNYALNRLKPNLRTKAIAVEPGTSDFHIAENIFSSSMYDRNLGGKTRVECDGIQETMSEFQPTALVLDVEGAEVDLLPVADLSSVDKIIVEVHPHVVGEGRIEDLRSYLRLAGFTRTKVDGISELYTR